MPQNLFPSNSLRQCFFFVLTVKENKQLCLKIKTNFKFYVCFFSLRQIGAESCFSVETMWLRKQGTCVTPIVQVICWRGRGRISLTQNDLYTNRALASEEIFNITAVCLSSHALNGLSTFNNAGKESNKSQSWIQFVRVLKHTCENKHILIADIVTVIEQGLLSTENSGLQR